MKGAETEKKRKRQRKFKKRDRLRKLEKRKRLWKLKKQERKAHTNEDSDSDSDSDSDGSDSDSDDELKDSGAMIQSYDQKARESMRNLRYVACRVLECLNYCLPGIPRL